MNLQSNVTLLLAIVEMLLIAYTTTEYMVSVVLVVVNEQWTSVAGTLSHSVEPGGSGLIFTTTESTG